MTTEAIIAIAAVYAALAAVTFAGLWAHWDRRDTAVAAAVSVLWPVALPVAGLCSLLIAWRERGRNDQP